MQKKVLTIDDEYQVREFVATVAEEKGYAPLQARDGQEALKIIQEELPDLIVLDVLMPGKSGIKLYRELRTDESLRGIPVVVYSGIARRTFLRTQIGASGIGKGLPEPDAYIEKPAKPAALARLLERFLG